MRTEAESIAFSRGQENQRPIGVGPLSKAHHKLLR